MKRTRLADWHTQCTCAPLDDQRTNEILHIKWTLRAVSIRPISSHHLIFYSLKTVVKRNCVQRHMIKVLHALITYRAMRDIRHCNITCSLFSV